MAKPVKTSPTDTVPVNPLQQLQAHEQQLQQRRQQQTDTVNRLAEIIVDRVKEDSQQLEHSHVFDLFSGLELDRDVVASLQAAVKAKREVLLQELTGDADIPERVERARGPASYFKATTRKQGKEEEEEEYFVRIADGKPYITFFS